MRAMRLLLLGLLAAIVSLPVMNQAAGQAAQATKSKAAVIPQPDMQGAYRIGDGVTSPKLIYQVEPEFSEAARKKKISGKCTVSALVGTDGLIQEVVTTKSIADTVPRKLQKAALSLDEEAKRAVRQYRFTPGMFQGKAVPVRVMIDVEFQIS